MMPEFSIGALVLIAIYFVFIAKQHMFYRQAAFGEYVSKRVESAKKLAANRAKEDARKDKSEGTTKRKMLLENASQDEFYKSFCVDKFWDGDFSIK